MPDLHTCERCGHVGPDIDFLWVRGNRSKSCNPCLDQFFKHNKFSKVSINEQRRAVTNGNRSSWQTQRQTKGRNGARPRKAERRY